METKSEDVLPNEIATEMKPSLLDQIEERYLMHTSENEPSLDHLGGHSFVPGGYEGFRKQKAMCNQS